jgi:hypothetical protein
MYIPEIKKNINVEVTVTLDNKNIEDVLEEICDICHDGLMDVSVLRQECEENPALNTAKNWREECENLEGKLCSILDLLKD